MFLSPVFAPTSVPPKPASKRRCFWGDCGLNGANTGEQKHACVGQRGVMGDLCPVRTDRVSCSRATQTQWHRLRFGRVPAPALRPLSAPEPAKPLLPAWLVLLNPGQPHPPPQTTPQPNPPATPGSRPGDHASPGRLSRPSNYPPREPNRCNHPHSGGPPGDPPNRRRDRSPGGPPADSTTTNHPAPCTPVQLDTADGQTPACTSSGIRHQTSRHLTVCPPED